MIEADWDAALAEGMRIVSADRWLDWTVAREGVNLAARGGDWAIEATTAGPAATLLFPAGTVPADDRVERSAQTLWGRTYEALTLRDLAPGETRTIHAGEASR